MTKHRITLTVELDPDQIHPDTVAACIYQKLRDMPEVNNPTIETVQAAQ